MKGRRLGGKEGAQLGQDQAFYLLIHPLLLGISCLQFLVAGWWTETSQSKAQGGTSMLRCSLEVLGRRTLTHHSVTWAPMRSENPMCLLCPNTHLFAPLEGQMSWA